MNVGISVPLPAYLVDVGFMARKVEELGFESFWCAEHPFIPVHSASRFPGSADGAIPEANSTTANRPFTFHRYRGLMARSIMVPPTSRMASRTSTVCVL